MEPEPFGPEFWPKPSGLHFKSIRPDELKTLGRERERERMSLNGMTIRRNDIQQKGIH
jgi:hypothetical protein